MKFDDRETTLRIGGRLKRPLQPFQKTAPTIEEQLNATRLREAVCAAALACGARPTATRHIVRDAENIFEWTQGQIVAKGGARDPLNPLQPLTLVSWLANLHEEEDFLFEPLAR